MNKNFSNYEIVLISNNTEDAQWVLKALKRSDLNNELIWLKDTDRTFDYINSDGLYAGKKLTAYTKVFIVDDRFPEAEKIKGHIAANPQLKDCEQYSLAESKEAFIVQDVKSSRKIIEDLFGAFQIYSLLLFA